MKKVRPLTLNSWKETDERIHIDMPIPAATWVVWTAKKEMDLTTTQRKSSVDHSLFPQGIEERSSNDMPFPVEWRGDWTAQEDIYLTPNQRESSVDHSFSVGYRRGITQRHALPC